MVPNPVIGLLDNGKPNAALILSALADVIGKQFKLAGIARASKRASDRGAAAPMSPDVRDRLVGHCDVLLNASGD